MQDCLNQRILLRARPGQTQCPQGQVHVKRMLQDGGFEKEKTLIVFRKVLVANRGEIAARVIRTLKTLNIHSVAIFHSLDKAAPWLNEADEAIEITGSTAAAAHLDIQQIVEISKSLGVDAVHPGYGFLAENSEFARTLSEQGIAFIGPSAEVIELMGDKIRSRDFVAKHGFPIPPGVSLAIDDPQFAAEVGRLGYPVVVKASAGGGGKGMNIVWDAASLDTAVRVAGSEAATYFGDDRVYVERYFTQTRHIEVQVLGDGEEVVHFGERECSIQRRFQKVVEEAPSPNVDDESRGQLGHVAVGIAKAAGYTGAGTVEFLYTPEGEFFFLEMNTRIQVEHPVTEMVYGVDLVAEQVRIAAGESLGKQQSEIVGTGHSIECRICAEDPDNDFLPETGKVLLLRCPQASYIRVESSLYPEQSVSTAFDPMLAKLVVYGDSRQQAIERTQQALREFVVLGVQTNIAFLQRVMAHPEFLAGNTDTAFIEMHSDDLNGAATGENDDIKLVVSTAYLSDRTTRNLGAVTPALYTEIGNWRN